MDAVRVKPKQKVKAKKSRTPAATPSLSVSPPDATEEDGCNAEKAESRSNDSVENPQLSTALFQSDQPENEQSTAAHDAIDENISVMSIELPASAPPYNETLLKKIYPDLQDINDMFVVKIEQPEPTSTADISYPKPMTETERDNLFQSYSKDYLENLEAIFIAAEKRVLSCDQPNDTEFQKFYSHVLVFGRLHHQLEGGLVKARKDLQSRIMNIDKEMWRLEDRHYEASGACADDRDITVRITYPFAVLDISRAEDAVLNLSPILDQMVDDEKGAYMKRQYVRNLLQKVIIQAGHDRQMCMRNLTVLCAAYRREENNEECTERGNCAFRTCLKAWITYVASQLLSSDLVEDRLHVLHHVLRFPGGMSSWATSLVQPLLAKPISPSPNVYLETLEDNYLRDIFMIVHTIMLPIAERDRFVGAGMLHERPGQDTFTWVDSDGEEESSTAREFHPLTETDMNSLLSQVPFSTIFQSMCTEMTEPSVYKLLHSFVVADVFVRILCDGCSTYGAKDRYKNFVKRLGQMIHHTVSYVNATITTLSLPMLQSHNDRARVLVEMDTFIYRVAGNLYKVRAAGLWQYLASLPFRQLTMPGLWRLYRAIRTADFSQQNTPFLPDDTNTSMLVDNETLLLDSGYGFYYALQMLSNMAGAREWKQDSQFISVIAKNCMQLLTVVPSSDTVKAEYLIAELARIAAEFPGTVSVLLRTVQEYRTAHQPPEEKPSTIVERFHTVLQFDKLPLHTWTASEADIDILLEWLGAYRPSSSFFVIAWQLFAHVNYGEKGGKLGVSRLLQLKILRRIVIIFREYAAMVETEGQLMVNVLEDRCLKLMMRLRIHAMDQPALEVQTVLNDPRIALPEQYIKHATDEPFLQDGLKQNCAVSSLAALLATTSGHWLPIFCHEGVQLLRILVHKKPEVAVRCLELITPMFADNPGVLAGDAEFLKLVAKLVQNDEAAEKSPLIKVGPLRSMIVTQIDQYRRYGFLSPAPLVELWAKCVIHSSEDFATDKPAHIMLDMLASMSLNYRDAWALMRQTVEPLLKNPAVAIPGRSLIGTIFQRFLASEPQSFYMVHSANNVSLSVLMSAIEHDQLEVQTGLWAQLLQVLRCDDKLTLNDALQKVCEDLGISHSPPANMVVLHKLAHRLTNTPIAHPQYPLLCQQYFTILLTRTPEDGGDTFGSKDRLLRTDEALSDRVRQCMKEAAQHYNKLQQRTADGTGSKVEMYKELQSMFEGFLVWMTDEQLDSTPLDKLDKLPKQYCTERLKNMFLGYQHPWVHLVDSSEKSLAERECMRYWLFTYRPEAESNGKPGGTPEAKVSRQSQAQHALLRRIGTYDPPEVPPVVKLDETVTILSYVSMPYHKRKDRILTALRKIDQHTERLHRPTMIEYRRLNREIFKKTKLLFTNETSLVRETAKCKFFCTGAAVVHVRVDIATRSELVWQRLEDSRRDFASTVEAAIYLPPHIMDQIVLVKMLWASFYQDALLANDPTEIGTMVRELKNLLRSTFALLRENSTDHLKYAVQDVILHSLTMLPSLGYEEVFRLVESCCTERRRPPCIVIDLVEADNIPVEQMKSLYGLLTKRSAILERALFVQIFGKKFDLGKWLIKMAVSPPMVAELCQLMAETLLIPLDLGDIGSKAETDTFYMAIIVHLVKLVEHKFPSNLHNVLHVMLNSVSANMYLPPTMLLELLNSLRARLALPALRVDMNDEAMRAAHCEFAEALASANPPGIQIGVIRTILKHLACHFAYQRQHNASPAGLYGRHKRCLKVVAILLGAIAHSSVLYDLCKRGTFSDTTVTNTFNLFEPWLVPYDQINPESTATAEKIHPWTAEFTAPASLMVKTLRYVVESALAKLEVSSDNPKIASTLLHQVCTWYNNHYNSPLVNVSVLGPIHKELLLLPWQKLRLSHAVLSTFKDLLERFVPECHRFIGKVFLAIPWDAVESGCIDETPEQAESIRSMLLLLCVKLGLEPSVRADSETRAAMGRLLQAATRLTWHKLTVSGLEPAMDWYTITANSTAVLRSTTAPNFDLDDALLNLLEVASQLTGNETNPLSLESGTCKRVRFIRTFTRHFVQAVAPKARAVAVTKHQQHIAPTMQRLFAVIVVLLEHRTQPAEDEQPDQSDERSREAIALATALILGIRSVESIEKAFCTEVIRLMNRGENSSFLLARSILAVFKLFQKHTPILLGMVEMALFVLLNTPVDDGRDFTWLRALETVGAKVVATWKPDTLAAEGNFLSMQLYFLLHWRDPEATLSFKREFIPSILALLKLSKKETNGYHIYPLWITMMYAVLDLAPDAPKGYMDGLVKKFTDYLVDIANQGTRFWIIGIMQQLMAGKRLPTTSQRIVAFGLAHCTSTAYRTVQSKEEDTTDADDNGPGETDAVRGANERGAGNAARDGEPQASEDVAASSTVPIADQMEDYRPLLSDPTMQEQRDQVEEMLKELPARLDMAAVLQFAVTIVEKFDANASHILRTLNAALRIE